MLNELKNMKPTTNRQTGFVLITVLLIVVLLTGLAILKLPTGAP